MPNLSLYIPLNRSRHLLLRLAVTLVPRHLGEHPAPRGHVDLPDYLKKDVGLPPEVERPPPLDLRFPF